MPQTKRQPLGGNCSTTLFYDLGTAHGRYQSKNVQEFAEKLIDLGYATLNLAPTNSEQNRERTYLEACGFKEVYRVGKGKGSMRLHAADSTEIGEALKPFIEERARKVKEEQERKRKEALEKMEREKKLAEEKAAREKIEMEKLAEALKTEDKITHTDDVTMEWVRETYKKFPTIPTGVIFNTLFGYKGIPNYVRVYDDRQLLVSINSRQKKRREVEAEKARGTK